MALDMEAASSATPEPAVKISSRAVGIVVAGYAVAAGALVAFITINGASAVSPLASGATAVLLSVGLLLPTAGMLMLRRGFGKTRSLARNGLILQGFGLVILLLGIILAVTSSSLSGFFAATFLLLVSGGSVLAGTSLFRKHYASIRVSRLRGVDYLLLGMVLLLSGMGLIVASNIAYEYFLSQAGNTVYADTGATVSACGCVVAAYSFFLLKYAPAAVENPAGEVSTRQETQSP
jgi:hypothetical protein